MPTPSLPALVSQPETRPIPTLASTSNGPPRVQPARVSIEGAVVADRVYRTAILAFALCVPILLLLILIEVGAAGWPALRQFGVQFLTSSEWDPVAGQFGAAPAIAGTIITSLVALALATPHALGGAIFISEFSPTRLRQPQSWFVDLPAAGPSVV
jgi:phosphate transport system permease protein